MERGEKRGMTKKLFIFFLLVVFSGCAAKRDPVRVESSPHEKKKSAVFGHLILDWRSDDLIESIDRLYPMVLKVVNEASGESFEIVCEPNGSDARFFARLPPGTYRIRKWSKGEAEFNLPAIFEVQEGEAAYLGTIQWVRIVSPLRPSAKTGLIRGRLMIGDLFEEEKTFLKEHRSEMKAPAVKAIMKIVQ